MVATKAIDVVCNHVCSICSFLAFRQRYSSLLGGTIAGNSYVDVLYRSNKSGNASDSGAW